MSGEPPPDDDPPSSLDDRDPFAPPPQRDAAIALDAPAPLRPSFAPRPSQTPPAAAPPTSHERDESHAPSGAQPAPHDAEAVDEVAVDAVVDPERREQAKPRSLRQRPALRLLIAVGLGLGAGWIFATPYARRAERAITEVRGQANAVRYSSDPVLRSQAATLDQLAEERSSSAALNMLLVWLVVGAGAAGAFLWFTRR